MALRRVCSSRGEGWRTAEPIRRDGSILLPVEIDVTAAQPEPGATRPLRAATNGRRPKPGTIEIELGSGRVTIPVPSGVRVWIATGHTDMRRGMQGLALQVQEQLKRNPHGGDLYVFRGRRGDLAKILWHDGVGLSLYAKRLDRGKFIWPSAKEGVISISAGQMAYMLEGIDWRNPQLTWRPKSAG